MAEDFTSVDDIQLAAVSAEGEDCPDQGDDAQGCAAGAGGDGDSQAREVVAVVPPPAGGEVILVAVAGEVYDLRFDPRLAEVRVIDADGDGDLDMVLVFAAGTADEAQIVFKDMVDAAKSGNPPLLQSGETYFGADAVVSQAQALAAERPTLETAAPGGQEIVGTGVTQYDDNLGTVIDLLTPQGVIPPVALTFPSLEPTEDEELLAGSPPQVEARIGSGAEFENVVVKEDANGGFVGDDFQGDPSTQVAFSATASGGPLTTIVITGFDNVANWDFDTSLVEAAVLDLGGSFTFDGATLTIDLTGLNQTDFSALFTANPPEDSDVDLGTLTIEANAVSDADPGLTASAMGTAEVLVDAILDEALELGADGANGGAESAAEQTFSLNLNSSLFAPFAGSGDGGSDTDGSETTTVLLTLDEALPAGASLTSTAGTVTETGNPNEYEVTGADIEAAVDGLQVTVPGGFDGTISGSLSTVSGEANTPEGAAPASGDEPDTADNTWSDSVDFAVTVTPGEVSPAAAVGLPAGVAAIKEDSSDNVVEFSAQSGDPTDELTSVVIELPGVAAGDVDVSQIESEAGVASVTVDEAGGTTTITVTFDDAADLTSFSSSFTLDAPAEDSDVDRTGVTVTANAKDTSDGSQTGSGGTGTTIVVDAVLDQAGQATQASAATADESAAVQSVALGLDFTFVGAGFDNVLPGGATGGDSGDGGPDGDGSEAVTLVTITVSAGTLELGAGAPAGSSLTDNGGGSYSLNVADPGDYEAAVEALQVSLPAGFDGTVTGSISVTTEEVSPSGGEPDTADNSRTIANAFSVEVAPGEVSPAAAIGLPAGVAAIKEDSRDNVVEFSAQSGDPTDELTTVVIELPNVLSGDVDGFDFGADAGKVASVDIADDGTDTTVTITLNSGVETLAGTFLLDAPAEDSDVDLSGVTITANAQDASDNSQTGSGGETITIAVDAILDEALELGADGANGGAESADEQTFSLNLESSLFAPFAGSGDGGSDTDGSETTTVLLTLDGPLPAGASLTSTAGTVTETGNPNEYEVTGADIEAAVDGLQVTVPAGFSGTVSGSLSTASGEANTPEGAAPASGDEPDTADNTWSDSVDFAVTVTPGEVSPAAAIGLPAGVAAIKEDSRDNVVEFSAQSGDPTDELTTVVIELPNVLSGDVDGFDFGADAGKVASVDIADDGTDTTVTITLNGGVETLAGTFLLDAPAEDSDVDLSGVTITANAQDASDNSQTGSGGETITIVVDAILDEAPVITQASIPEVDESTSGAQTILLGLDFAMADAGFAGSLAGGADTDGSEAVTSVTVSLSDGTLVLEAGYAGSAVLTDNGGGSWTLSGWTDAADLETAVEALSVEVAEGFDGTVTGSISTVTQEANTPEGTVPASGDEPDTSDNVDSDTFYFSLVVDSLPTAGNLDIAVDEDDLPSGNSDVAAGDDLADPSQTVIMGSLTFDLGADAAGGGVDFAALDGLAVEDTGGDPVTSGSVALVYDWNAATNTLTALANATPVFTVVLTDPSTGAFTFTLLEEVDHPTAGTEDNLTIAMAFTATDGDGDTATGTLTVDIDDDSPAPFAPEAAEVVNQLGGGSGVADLDAGDKVGADEPGSIVFSGGSDGDILMGSIGGAPVAALESDGHQIILTGFGTDTLTGFLDENDNGVLDGGETTEVIRIDLMPGADTYTVTLSQMIANGEQVVFDDFSGISGNNNVFFPLDSSNDPGSVQDLLITATVPGTNTVNTDNDDIGSGDQWLNNDNTPVDGEIIRLDYVENVAGDPDDISSLSYTQHYVANDAGFRVNQLQGNSSVSRSVLVRVYDEDDDPQGSDFASAAAGDPLEQDDITSVRVEAGDGTFGASYDGGVFDGVANVFSDGRFTFTFGADGSIQIDGLLTSDQVFVSTDDGFTQMEIQNVTSGGNLGIALDNFAIGVQQTGDPIDIATEVTLTDDDGDSAIAGIDITLVPNLLVVGSNQSDLDGQSSLHTVANPDDARSGAIEGSDGNDLLIGDPGGVEVAGQFNIAIAVDVTGSIGPGNIATLNAAVETLVQQIIDEDIAEKTAIRLITFAVRGGQSTSGLEYAKTFTWDGTQFVAADAQTLADAIDDEVANPDGSTDFEPALQDAADFFNGLNRGTGPAEDDVNRIFFMTDGQDNSGPGGDFDPDNVPDIYGLSGLIAEDDLKIEVFGIQSSGGQASGFDADQLNLVDDGLPSQPGEALHVGEPAPVDDVEADITVVGFDDLGTALSETLITTLSSVGGDTISGGDRDEIIFGDVPNTDPLAVSEGIALSPGSGWFVFRALEDGQGTTSTWDRSDTTDYLRDPDHWSDLVGAGRGEGDTIDGGAGNDVIFGQGGDDLITGGSGADTFVFNLAADEGSDTITDFDGGEDSLHFTDVVDGAGGDIQDVNDMIDSIVDNGSGDVQVNFTNGTSVDFDGVGFAGQTSIADLVDSNTQVVVDHV